MQEDIRKYVVQYALREGYGDSDDDDDIWETLTECGKEIYREVIGDRRWWTDLFIVVDLGGRLIGYYGASTTGDRSPNDVGWEYDLDTCCDVIRTEETRVIVTYDPKPLDNRKESD